MTFKVKLTEKQEQLIRNSLTTNYALPKTKVFREKKKSIAPTTTTTTTIDARNNMQYYQSALASLYE
jgi:hypothetical protein